MNNFLKKFSFSIVVTAGFISFPITTQAFSLYPGGYTEAANGDLSNNRLAPTQLGIVAPGTNTLAATFNAVSSPSTTPPVPADPDYFTFTVPEGYAVTGIRLLDWATEPDFEDIAFIAIEEGETFDFVFGGGTSNPITNPNPATGLLGWSHLRSTQVGTNKILTEMSSSNLDPFQSGLNASVIAEAASNPYEGLGLTPAQITALTNNLLSIGTIGNPSSPTPNNGWYPGATGFDKFLLPGTYSMWLRQGSTTRISVALQFETTPIPESGTLAMLGAVAALGIGSVFKRTIAKK